MSVIDLNSRRPVKKLSFTEICDKFLEKTEPIVHAQMGEPRQGRWRLLLGDTFLSAAGEVAGALAKTDLAENCTQQRAENVARFIWSGQYPETIFQLILGEEFQGFAQQARNNGMLYFANALDVERDTCAEIVALTV